MVRNINVYIIKQTRHMKQYDIILYHNLYLLTGVSKYGGILQRF
jgi:hypothetical protein